MKFDYAKNASRLHKKIGEILETQSPFLGIKANQEVLVSSLFDSYSGKERYDWVIPSLFLIIECHGKQHYEVQTFGDSVENAIMNFQEQKIRDSKKKEIALLNGWTFIEVPYTDEKILDAEYLWNKFKTNENKEKIQKEEKKEVDLYREDRLAREKAWRRKQYRQSKEYKEQMKNAKNNRSNRFTSSPSDKGSK